MKVEINKNHLTIHWPDGRKEEFPLSTLKKVAIITTDKGPFEPDVFWWLFLDIPIMIPDDSPNFIVPSNLPSVHISLSILLGRIALTFNDENIIISTNQIDIIILNFITNAQTY